MKTENVNIWSVSTVSGDRFHVTSEFETVDKFTKVLEKCEWLSILDRENGKWILRDEECVKTEYVESFHLSMTDEEVVVNE